MENTNTECVVCTGITVQDNVCKNCGAIDGKPQGVFTHPIFTGEEVSPVAEEIPKEEVSLDLEEDSSSKESEESEIK